MSGGYLISSAYYLFSFFLFFFWAIASSLSSSSANLSTRLSYFSVLACQESYNLYTPGIYAEG